MTFRDRAWRFWLPVLGLLLFTVYSGQKLVRAHLEPEKNVQKYDFTRALPARRGSIFAAHGRLTPLVRTVPYWNYALDPVALTNCVAIRRGEKVPQTKRQILTTIANALDLDYAELERKSENTRNLYQQLKCSSDPEIHAILKDSTRVVGLSIKDKPVRTYLLGRSLAHVLGALNAEGVGFCGIEQKFNRELIGTPGVISGKRDGKRRELYDRRIVSVAPQDGADIYLTIDADIQLETEAALRFGMEEYGAGSAWAIVMDAATGAIYAMASFPDFAPAEPTKASKYAFLNKAVAFNYEPGSVMKVLTAAAAIEADPQRYGPETSFRTNRDDPRYYRLPGDGSHVWNPTMTLREAIVHSSNIVIGKLAYDLGPQVLYNAFTRFGLGRRTGIELPGEERGLLRNPSVNPWDLASRSRAGIGQSLAVTAIQLISAYQAIANDGVRMQPYLIERITSPDGQDIRRHTPVELGRPISSRTAQMLREMMTGVAAPGGTARRAAIRGYSIAGKTGTAQKENPSGKGYAQGLYRATFCGMVPAVAPQVVILVTLDFDRRTTYHQGGNSAGPVFRRIALAATRYLEIAPDCPEKMDDGSEEDEFDKILEERAQLWKTQLPLSE